MQHLMVLLLTLASILVRSSACPSMCHCRSYPISFSQDDHYVSIRCTEISTNFSNVNTSNIQEFALVNATLENFDYFKLLPNLKRLSLSNSLSSKVNLTNLAKYSNIQNLDISNNGLQSLWNSSNLSHFIVLDLSRNNVQLNGNEFNTMKKLEFLNISYNKIADLHPDLFKDLSNLKFLDISCNEIKTITEKVFQPLLTLLHLNLSNNKLETLDDFSFEKLIKLQQLDLSNNLLINVTTATLQMPSLTRLLLTGNVRLGEINETVLVGNGPRLQIVEASNLGLKQVPSSLTQSIRTLRLCSNAIRDVNCGDFDSYPLIQLLDLTSNCIGFVEEDALGRLEFLTVLYLSDNKIKNVPKNLPERLQALHLEDNLISEINRDDFFGPANLEVLLLADNKISVIEADAFSQLNSLVTLDLSNNPIKSLPPGQLGLIRLQVLKLSSIDLISPAEDVSFPLSYPDRLIRLDLSNSPGLARQFLKDVAALAAAKELQELDVSSTQLSELRSDLFHYLPQLKALHLDDNKLNCTFLHWLASWMRQQNDQIYQKILCFSPPALWGTPLLDLQSNEIGDSSRVTTNKPNRLIVNRSHLSNKSKRVSTSVNLNHHVKLTNYDNVKKNSTPNSIKVLSSYTKVEESQNVPRKEKTTLFVDVIPKWNETDNMEMSLPIRDEEMKTHHLTPGVVILTVGVLSLLAILTMYVTKFFRKSRRDVEIDVSSLPSVMELW